MAKARIQIVEDEYILAKGIATQLADMGYQVTGHASSGEQAVAMAKKDRPDLVLMDIVMPGEYDGVEAAARIRTNLNIPVIFLTAHSDEETVQKAKLTEPHAYLLKPFTERELYIAIEMALHRARARKDAAGWNSSSIADEFDPDLL
ncbi:MAG: response regulator [Deltaproteobacteria bacterium]|nr:response regulator [Deltaproteobacteria bacterium]